MHFDLSQIFHCTHSVPVYNTLIPVTFLFRLLLLGSGSSAPASSTRPTGGPALTALFGRSSSGGQILPDAAPILAPERENDAVLAPNPSLWQYDFIKNPGMFGPLYEEKKIRDGFIPNT
jgi:hypothetical protein